MVTPPRLRFSIHATNPQGLLFWVFAHAGKYKNAPEIIRKG